MYLSVIHRFYPSGREFASIELDGIPYMTPQDFLESVTDDFPRPRVGRLKLRPEDVDDWLRTKTPARAESSAAMFRKMHNKVVKEIDRILGPTCSDGLTDGRTNRAIDIMKTLVTNQWFVGNVISARGCCFRRGSGRVRRTEGTDRQVN